MPDFCGICWVVLLGMPELATLLGMPELVEELGIFNFDGNKLLSFPMTAALGAESLDLGIL